MLDEGLPESYERTLFKQKCDNVFDLVVDYSEPWPEVGSVTAVPSALHVPRLPIS